jgi:hypothetical protein
MEPARTQKLEIAELNPQRASSSRDFLCRIRYLCWNLTKENSENRRWPTALHFDCFGMAAASTRRPVIKDLAASRHRLFFATDSSGNAFPS